MLKELDDYDWGEVFKYATPHLCEGGHEHGPNSVLFSRVSTEGFTREDVVEIIKIDEGYRDEDTWLGVFKLADGRYACIRAWCDYTGWG